MAIVKGTAKFKATVFSKGDFMIAGFEPEVIEEGSIQVDPKWGTFTMKGNMPPLKKGEIYQFCAEEENHPKYGVSYSLVFLRQDIALDESDPVSVKAFLEATITEKQVEALFEITDNPIKLIKEHNIEAMVKAKGIGVKTAERIIENYESQKDYSFAYAELGKYEIPPKTIKKICDIVKSPELAVKKIVENPYSLMNYGGYGFKTCDELFFKLGGHPDSPVRIKAFLVFALEEQVAEGHTWCTPMDLIEYANEYIPTANKALIGKILTSNDDLFYLTEDKKRVSLLNFQKLEALVSKELKRLMKAPNRFVYDGWREEVAKVEEAQGWNFTDQQIDAMNMMLENNVCILQGYGGTGKTTSLKAVVDILEANGFSYAQCALSGKASNNIALVTKKDGYTIHRLLGFSPMKGGFQYNKQTPLPYDIIILDELSMVDARLFGHLLLAIKEGCKLIMLGDSEQLESIGIPVMKPMIESGRIPTMTLTKIHRQAQKSAIITHSIAIRNGKNLMKNEIGRQVYGELEDLYYDVVEDEDDIFVKVIREFHTHIQVKDIRDVQILSATRDKGKVSCYVLNQACQKIYNPESSEKKQVKLGRKGFEYALREGDKVINIVNNYKAVDVFGMECPIFNGSTGILLKFDSDDDGEFMVIDFEGIGEVKVYQDQFPTIELAYCITTHKSQGSGIDTVIVAFPFHYMLNSRQFLYTAMTRARKHCTIATSYRTMRSAVSKDVVSNKRTYLAEYLCA